LTSSEGSWSFHSIEIQGSQQRSPQNFHFPFYRHQLCFSKKTKLHLITYRAQCFITQDPVGSLLVRMQHEARQNSDGKLREHFVFGGFRPAAGNTSEKRWCCSLSCPCFQTMGWEESRWGEWGAKAFKMKHGEGFGWPCFQAP